MKQTNNAIKFLMAQYRAIFKNANLKMFLAAATAAAAMAATQAQAADASKWADLAEGSVIETSTPVTMDDSSELQKNFDLTVRGAGSLTFQPTTYATAYSVKEGNTGKIVLNGDKASVTVGNATSGATVKITEFNGYAGALTIGGHASDVSTLEAATITLGGTASKAADAAAATTITATLEKNATLGGAKSNITLKAGSELKANATVASDEFKKSTIAASTLTLETGSKLTVEDAKGLTVNASTVTVSGGATVSNGTGSTLALGGKDISFAAGTLSNKGTIDLGTVGTARANVALSVDADAFNTQLFSGASTLTITGTGGQSAKLDISVTGDEAVDLVKSGLIDASNGGLAASGLKGTTATDIEVGVSGKKASLAADTYKAGTDFKSVELSFDDLTVGKADSSKDFTIDGASSIITVGSSLTHANAEKGIQVVSGGILNLHNNDAAKLGTVTAKGLTVGATTGNASKLDIQGKWSIPSLSIVSGSANLTDATVTLQKDAVLTTKDNANQLILGNSSLDVTAGKVQLGESGAVLNTGSKLSIDKTQLYTVDESGKTVTLVADDKNNKVVTKSLKTDGTGVLEIMNAGEGVSAEVASDIKTKLAYDGFIQFGAGGSITPSTDETVSFTKGTNLDVVGVYNNSQLVMDGADNTINKNVAAGSLKLNKKDNVGVVDGKGLILSNASTGENMFVQTSEGKLGDLQLKGTGAVNLNGEGQVGNINAATAGNGTVLIGSAAYGKQTAVEVSGSIGGTAAVGNVDMYLDSITSKKKLRLV